MYSTMAGARLAGRLRVERHRSCILNERQRRRIALTLHESGPESIAVDLINMRAVIPNYIEVNKPTCAAQDYDQLLDCIGDARFVLICEASHGTHEFYRRRAVITTVIAAAEWDAPAHDLLKLHRARSPRAQCGVPLIRTTEPDQGLSRVYELYSGQHRAMADP